MMRIDDQAQVLCKTVEIGKQERKDEETNKAYKGEKIDSRIRPLKISSFDMFKL